MEWERERSPWSRTGFAGRAAAALRAVLEQDARPRKAPPRHQGGGYRRLEADSPEGGYGWEADLLPFPSNIHRCGD